MVGQINGYNYADRSDRPTTKERVGLRASFYNQGSVASPVAVSGVTLFSKNDFPDPSSVLGSDGLILSSITSSVIKYHWSTDFSLPINGAGGGNTTSGTKDTSSYNEQANDGSTVWWLGASGNFAVILEGQKGSGDPSWPSAPAATYSFHGSSVTIPLAASTAGEYFEVWTVQLAADLPYTSFIFPASLYYDAWVGLSEPLHLTTSHRLITKKIAENSTTDIKIATEVTVHNKALDSAMKNVLNDTLYTNLAFQLHKINENPSDELDPIVSVKPEGKSIGGTDGNYYWSTTSNTYPGNKQLSPIHVGADRTIIIPMDFRMLGGGSFTSGNRGAMGYNVPGTWRVRCRYDLIGETVISPWMHFIVF